MLWNGHEETPILIDKQSLAPKVTRYVVRAPGIARRHKPGQFVIVRLHEGGERIPLTIADADNQAGTITLIVQEVGKSTAEMAHMMRVGLLHGRSPWLVVYRDRREIS